MAGVGGISRPRNGRADDGRGEGVSQGRGGCRAVGHITTRAQEQGIASRGAGGGKGRLHKVMPQGLHMIGGVPISTAVGADIVSIALLAAGGDGDCGSQSVSQGRYVVGSIAVAALTFIEGISLLNTGGRGAFLLELVSRGGHEIALVAELAIPTAIDRVACVRAGGIKDLSVHPQMVTSIVILIASGKGDKHRHQQKQGENDPTKGMGAKMFHGILL